MSNIAQLYPSGTKSHYFNPAVIVDSCDENGFIEVDLPLFQQSGQVFARIAVPLNQALDKGDAVLIAGDDVTNLFVIGVLSNKAPVKLPQRQEIGEGAYVMIDNANQSPLRVYSRKNELLVEYDPKSEKTRINIDKGDLEFTTHSGDIVFDSSHNIRLNGESIDLASRTNIKLSVTDVLGKLKSSLSIKPDWLKLSSSEIDIRAQRSEVHISEMHYLGKTFSGSVENSKLIAGKLTTIANSITEKTKNAYRTVEQLSQLKAGRMRTLVSNTFHFKAKKSYMKAEDDFKVNADKIHLG